MWPRWPWWSRWCKNMRSPRYCCNMRPRCYHRGRLIHVNNVWNYGYDRVLLMLKVWDYRCGGWCWRRGKPSCNRWCWKRMECLLPCR